MARGWDWIDDIAISEEEMDARTPLLNELAQMWSDLHDRAERKRFARESDAENGYDEPDLDESEAGVYALRQQIHDEQQDAQLRVIEDKIFHLGARMMRAYEHWNEDEAFVRYQECERFGDYCD